MKKALLVAAMMLLVPTVPALAQEDFTVTEEDKGILNCGQADWYPPDCTGYPQPWVINPEVMQYDHSGSRAQEDGYCVDGVCGNPPIDSEDIIGYYWDCFYPDSAPELVSCGWNPIYSPDVPRVGYAQ